MNTKHCPNCNKEKLKSDFYENGTKSSGYTSWCRFCINKKARNEYYTRREKAIKILGNKCAACGFNDKRALQVDHINGKGNLERYHHGTLAKIIKGEINNYQCLCANCNWIKRYENKEGNQILQE